MEEKKEACGRGEGVKMVLGVFRGLAQQLHDLISREGGRGGVWWGGKRIR